MQSILQSLKRMLPPGPVTRRRIARTLIVYGLVWSAGTILLSTDNARLKVLGLGLILPGGGFLQVAEPDGAISYLMFWLASIGFLAFFGAGAVWFATGMILLPPATWLIAAMLAAILSQPDFAPWPAAIHTAPFVPIILLLAGIMPGLCRGRAARGSADAAKVTVPAEHASPTPHVDEMSLDDLARLRLLLDRALQPAETFNGFEWRDQFQTAAIRYQVNFLSYALSMAQQTYAPAARAYFARAQTNLFDKQQDARIWNYWERENRWGYFDKSADPFARDNIMFSGFVATQMALAEAASGFSLGLPKRQIVFNHRSGRSFTWTLDTVVEHLDRQYRAAPFGLLGCEPNWIYPLCNLITVAAIKANDARAGTTSWSRLAPRFRQSFEAEFLTRSGRIVPFRSSAIGFSAPPIGGTVMQAFPCLFLNAVLPEIAARHWEIARHDLRRLGLRRALWPVDVGNYRFSRASSYAATAVAAAEMGDGGMRDEVLSALAEECPEQTVDGIAHRPEASLWAHAVEMMARCTQTQGFRRLVASNGGETAAGPFIKAAPYPDVLVARAVAQNGALETTVHPGSPRPAAALTIGGLKPRQAYRVRGIDIADSPPMPPVNCCSPCPSAKPPASPCIR